MVKDLEAINRVRVGNGLPFVNVGVMGAPSFHDRFLVVDDTIWLFGNSFRSLGNGTVSMASRVRDTSILLPVLVDASSKAEPFVRFSGTHQASGRRPMITEAAAPEAIETWFLAHEADLANPSYEGEELSPEQLASLQSTLRDAGIIAEELIARGALVEEPASRGLVGAAAPLLGQVAGACFGRN